MLAFYFYPKRAKHHQPMPNEIYIPPSCPPLEAIGTTPDTAVRVLTAEVATPSIVRLARLATTEQEDVGAVRQVIQHSLRCGTCPDTVCAVKQTVDTFVALISLAVTPHSSPPSVAEMLKRDIPPEIEA
jgi:hypothetical protein